MKILSILGLIVLSGAAGCATPRAKPCTQGGQSAREGAQVFQGIKKCTQVADGSGGFVNEGKYYEWYPDDRIALTGEYRMGKKVGRWIEYDRDGNKISDKYFEEGKEVPHP